MYRTLLVPVDGSAAAKAGLEEAIRLARAVGARLHLMNVVDDRAFDGDGDGDGDGNGDDPDAATIGDVGSVVRERGETVLRDAQTIARRAGVVSATALVQSGGDDLQTLVARQAEESGADLVVLGTHAGQPLSRMFLSHDNGHLLNVVAVPVLLVRSADADAGVTVFEITGSDPTFQS